MVKALVTGVRTGVGSPRAHAAYLELHPRKAEAGDLQSKQAKKTNHISVSSEFD